jgi:hypothetical protein
MKSTSESARSARTPHRLLTCRRGAVSVEYLLVSALCGLTLALVLVSLGPGLVRGWSYSRQVLYGRAP